MTAEVTKSSRRGPYAKTARVQQAILDAAGEVFALNGYNSGSIREVANRVGMSETGVLHHFPSKEALVLGVLENRDRWQESRMTALAPGAGAIEESLRISRANMREPGAVALYCVLSAEATSPDHVAHDFFSRRYENSLANLTETFTYLDAQGLLHAGRTPAGCARGVIAMMDGLQIQWLFAPEDVDMHAELRSYLETLIDPEFLDTLNDADSGIDPNHDVTDAPPPTKPHRGKGAA